jgi:proline iminopeptidase
MAFRSRSRMGFTFSMTSRVSPIAYDPRNRGRADTSGDGNIHRDVDDLETVRRHFEIERIDLIGHSFVGLMVALYGMKYPAHVNRTVQIGPMEPVAGKQYPAHLTNADGVFGGGVRATGAIAKRSATRRRSRDVQEVLGGAGSHLRYGSCRRVEDRLGLRENSSVDQSVRVAEIVSKLRTPVLTIHGTRDRSASYGGGPEWASMLPDARLVTIDGAAHAPWIEAPEKVFGAVRTFFEGRWPEDSEKVELPDLMQGRTGNS